MPFPHLPPSRRRSALSARAIAAAMACATALPTGSAALAATPDVAASLSTPDHPERQPLSRAQIGAFLTRFQKAWSSRDDADFAAIWKPDGRLVYPFANRTLQGRELPLLNAITKKQAPDLKWRMLGWTSQGQVVVVEWESANIYGGRLVTWRGVDKITLEDGRIAEEVVYADTAPFQAMRRGVKFDALIALPD